VKVKIKTDAPMKWSSNKKAESEIVFDTNEGEHNEGRAMLVGLVGNAVSKLLWNELDKITIKRLNK
tara:strand:+ start:545 stop:742 length:198 start_codon:yes stop_codon:yes gene_type:complete